MIKTQIILAGIGGQGILFAARIFSEMGLKLGADVLGSETHGMSQRGGSVLAHLKLGDFHSPLIRTGAADILYSFADEESYRSFKFLKSGGVCFLNIEDSKYIDPKVLAHLKSKGIVFRNFDANRAAAQMGFIRSANILLIGYSVGSGLVPFEYDVVRSVIESVSRVRDIEMNLAAFETGFQEGKS
jgi:indolepyruvate ferredoxin oxidoreductase beta subunit